MQLLTLDLRKHNAMARLRAPLYSVNHIRAALPRGCYLSDTSALSSILTKQTTAGTTKEGTHHQLAIRLGKHLVTTTKHVSARDIPPRSIRSRAPEHADALREQLTSPEIGFLARHVVVEDFGGGDVVDG